MFPYRISVLTYNLWNTQRWPEREESLREFFKRFQPDVFCLQELSMETRTVLDQALPVYLRIEDPFPGWTLESNIYWNTEFFDLVDHGVEDIKINSNPYRGMFWARLRLKNSNKTIFISTAHFTYQEHPDELRTGQSPRFIQAIETVKALKRLVITEEPAFFMGDLNDPVLPTYKLAEAGFQSCFVRLGLVPPPTWPSFPTANIVNWQRLTTQTMDWIVSNRYAKPISAMSPHFYLGDFSPSDHWPVLAIYQLE